MSGRNQKPKPVMQVYVSKNGQRYGPYSREELQHEVDAGVFKSEHFALCEGETNWVRIGEMPEISSGPTSGGGITRSGQASREPE